MVLVTVPSVPYVSVLVTLPSVPCVNSFWYSSVCTVYYVFYYAIVSYVVVRFYRSSVLLNNSRGSSWDNYGGNLCRYLIFSGVRDETSNHFYTAIDQHVFKTVH
jgi:hypothetical protein